MYKVFIIITYFFSKLNINLMYFSNIRKPKLKTRYCTSARHVHVVCGKTLTLSFCTILTADKLRINLQHFSFE